MQGLLAVGALDVGVAVATSRAAAATVVGQTMATAVADALGGKLGGPLVLELGEQEQSTLLIVSEVTLLEVGELCSGLEVSVKASIIVRVSNGAGERKGSGHKSEESSELHG